MPGGGFGHVRQLALDPHLRQCVAQQIAHQPVERAGSQHMARGVVIGDGHGAMSLACRYSEVVKKHSLGRRIRTNVSRVVAGLDRKSTRLNPSTQWRTRMLYSACTK